MMNHPKSKRGGPRPGSGRPRKVRKAGRPTLYRTKFVEIAAQMCMHGATNAELADRFKVNITTIDNWKAQHPDFRRATQINGDAANQRVEQALFHRAVGYSHDAVKILSTPGGVEIVQYREHLPPETAAASLWLRNRKPKDWRDKTTVDLGADVSLLELVNRSYQPPPALPPPSPQQIEGQAITPAGEKLSHAEE